jgi:putative chitinase
MGNGNEQSGEGWKFRGRGLIQLTGKSNYTRCSQAMFGDSTLLENPDVLTQPYYAIHSACWFWTSNGLNELADAQDLRMMTKKINGGFIGLDDRVKHYNHALEILQS